MINPENGKERASEEPDGVVTPENLGLELAFHLRQAPVINPAYKEELRSRLADRVRAGGQGEDHSHAVTRTGVEAFVAVRAGGQGEDHSHGMYDIGIDGEGSFRSDESGNEGMDNIDDFGSDEELTALAEHLRQTAPSTVIDPSFQESLRRRILDVVHQRRSSDRGSLLVLRSLKTLETKTSHKTA